MDQFSADQGLTTEQKMDAYADVKEHFGLKHQQRSLLDVCPQYPWILRAAIARDWDRARDLLIEAGIVAA